MVTSPNLNAAIGSLYRAFSAYPLPQYTDPCLHCHTHDDEAKLHTAPLRQMSASTLESYANDALLVWGEVSTFKHFLPRIFELLFTTSEPTFQFVDPESLFSKFRHGQWLTWPMKEQDAVRTLLHSIWEEVLGDPQPEGAFTDIQSWLCSIAQTEDDLTPYLKQWIEDQRMSAALALSSIILTGAGRNAFWDGREDQYAQLQDWQKSSAVIKRLQQAKDLAANITEEKDEFEAALGCIGFMHS